MEAAEAAIRHIGTNSLPWLVKWIREAKEAQPWRSKLRLAADKMPAVISSSRIAVLLLNERAERRAENALCSFRILGPPAISELTRSAKEGLPSLLTVLVDTRQQDRALATSYIAYMEELGTNASLAVPVLVQCLSEKDSEVAVAAADAFGKLKVEPGAAVPALADSLQDSRPRVRVASANSLADFGEQARPAVPALVKALSDSDIHVRGRVTNALLQIAPEALKQPGAPREGNLKPEN